MLCCVAFCRPRLLTDSIPNPLIHANSCSCLCSQGEVEELERLGVEHVISVLPNPMKIDMYSGTYLAGAKGHSNIEVEDEPEVDLTPYFAPSYTRITTELAAGRGVLVHCNRGVSRSATIVAAFLMRRNDWGLRRTAEHMLRARPVVDPNAGFIAQLRAYDRHLRSGADPAAFPTPELRSSSSKIIV